MVTVEEAVEATSCAPAGIGTDVDIVTIKINTLGHLKVLAGEISRLFGCGVNNACNICKVCAAFNKEGILESTASLKRSAYGLAIPLGNCGIVNRLVKLAVTNVKLKLVILCYVAVNCGSCELAHIIVVCLNVSHVNYSTAKSFKSNNGVVANVGFANLCAAGPESDDKSAAVGFNGYLISRRTYTCEGLEAAYGAFIYRGIYSLIEVPAKIKLKVAVLTKDNILKAECAGKIIACALYDILVAVIEYSRILSGLLVVYAAVVINLKKCLKLKGNGVVGCRCNSLVSASAGVNHEALCIKNATVKYVGLCAVNVATVTCHVVSLLIIGILENVSRCVKSICQIKSELIVLLIVLTCIGGEPLNGHLCAVLGEVEHANHACATLLGIHPLCVNNHLVNNVAVVTLGLEKNYVLKGSMSAQDKRDVGMLGKELIPYLLTVVIASEVVANAGINVVCRTHTAAGGNVVIVNGILVKRLVTVGGYDNSMIGMSKNNLVCPIDHLITDTEVKSEEEIVGLTEGSEHVGASAIALYHKAIELAHVGFGCEVLKEVLGLVVVTTGEGVGDLAIEL